MPKSLLEQLPDIVAKGWQQAEKILESLGGRHRIGLQTRKWVLPSKDAAEQDWIQDNERKAHLEPLAHRERGRGEGKAVELEQKPTVIEQFAYSDTWSDGTASYLAMITPQLILMRERLSDSRTNDDK